MAGEIQVAYGTTAKTLDAIVRNAVGQAWRTDTNVFEAYATANRANYLVTLTEQGSASGFYIGTFPSAITIGVYSVTAYVRTTGSAAESDAVAGTEERFHWTGSAAQSFPSNFASLGVSAAGKISGVVLVDTLTTYTGDTPQTGDSFARIGVLGAGLTGVVLAAAGLNAVLVDGKTLPAALQYIASSTAGKVSGAGTGTEVFLGLDGSTTRLTITVDSSGNRSAITYG